MPPKVSAHFEALLTRLVREPMPQGLSAYGAHYIQVLCANPTYLRSLFEHLLQIALKVCSNKNPGELVLVDFGGGVGLFSVYAKMCGIGKVIYVDNFEGIRNDALVLAQHLRQLDVENVGADYFVLGEVAELAANLQQQGLQAHVVVTSEVLEHIYDSAEFFAQLNAVNGEGLPPAVVMSTTSNERSPLRRKRNRAFHHTDEFVGSPADDSIRGIDSLRPFREVRCEIIMQALAQDPRTVEADTLQILVDHTRGLRKKDIENVVRNFLQTGLLPPPPAHATNTCDPLTGSWTERLMDPLEMAIILRNSGYEYAEAIPGQWHPSQGLPKRVLGAILNAIILSLKATLGSASPLAFVAAPSFILVGASQVPHR